MSNRLTMEDSIRTELLTRGIKRKRKYTYYIFKCKTEGCDNEFKSVKSCIKIKTGFCKDCCSKRTIKIASKKSAEIANSKRVPKFNEIKYVNCNHCNSVFVRKKSNRSKKKFCRRKCGRDHFNTTRRSDTIEKRYAVAKAACTRSRYKDNPRRKFELTFEEYKSIYNDGKCYYCSGDIKSNGVGLDRIDNLVGYRSDNVLPSCGQCNKLRGDYLTVSEAKSLIDRLKELRGDDVWGS